MFSRFRFICRPLSSKSDVKDSKKDKDEIRKEEEEEEAKKAAAVKKEPLSLEELLAKKKAEEAEKAKVIFTDSQLLRSFNIFHELPSTG